MRTEHNEQIENIGTYETISNQNFDSLRQDVYFSNMDDLSKYSSMNMETNKNKNPKGSIMAVFNFLDDTLVNMSKIFLNGWNSMSFILVIAVLSMTGCNSQYKLDLVVPDEDAEFMTEMTKQINDHSRFEISVTSESSLTETDAIERILSGKFDLTTVDNTIDYKKPKDDIRTVIPFFHEVMVVLSKHQFNQNQIDSLIKAGDYLVLAKEEEELNIYKKMIPNYTGNHHLNYRIEQHYDLLTDLESNMLVLFFSDRSNHDLGDLLFNKEAFIYSLDDPELRGAGSFLEGFCKDYKKTTPYMLPRHAFGIVMEKPVYTMAVHELLIAGDDLAGKVIYDLMEVVHHHHVVPIFESYNNYTFEANQQDINLTFPFHTGTLDYLNREKPKFVERYAEVMGFILSAFVLLFGIVASLRATINQRKKDRMDEYYKELLILKGEIADVDPNMLKVKLIGLQKKVFQLLIDEKLSANNEFIIFMMLWEELEQKRKELVSEKYQNEKNMHLKSDWIRMSN